MKKLKKIIKSINTLYFFIYKLNCRLSNVRRKHGRLVVNGSGNYRIKKNIKGKNNVMFVGEGAFINESLIRIIGNNNKIIFEENVVVGPQCSFWIEGDGIEIRVGKNTTFTLHCHINAQENESRIIIGEDCMFANNIIVRTSDSHPIIDLKSGLRTNPPKDVILGKHVWVAPQAMLMKGTKIGDGSIVGARAVLTKEYPENSLIVGSPGKVVKSDVSWTRDRIVGC